MRVEADIPSTPKALANALEGWIQRSQLQLRDHPEWPRLYASGVRYQRQPPGGERWQTVAETLERGTGDCDQLVVWRVAELRERDGETGARPIVVKTRRPGLFHALVRRGDGRLEDPSRRLGMRSVTDNGRSETMAGQEARAKVETSTAPDGSPQATIKWRGKNYVITVEARGATSAEASARASTIAGAVFEGLTQQAQSPARKALETLIPPQARAAIAAAKLVSGFARKGILGRMMRRMEGPTLSLAKNLLSSSGS
ncbi:MAG: hypothetical protein ACRCU1_15225 [Alsobacter sp.]